MKIPLLLDLNMMDIAQKSGLEIDLWGMSETFGILVLGTSIKSGEGRDELLSAIDTMAEGGGKKGTFSLSYPHLQEPLVEMERLLSSEASPKCRFCKNFLLGYLDDILKDRIGKPYKTDR